MTEPAANEPSAEEIVKNLDEVHAAIRAAKTSAEHKVRLVGVSKTKSVPCLKAAYDAGLRVFGENYVNEIVEKAPLLPADIEWHFIGHLQSNKVKQLLSAVPRLAVLETVDSEKLAEKLDKAAAEFRAAPDGSVAPLTVYVQVNTSGEESKSGVEPGAACVELAKFVHVACKNLRLDGLMTIGMPDYTSTPDNFNCLLRCRAEVAEALGVAVETLELSMGMSGDFASAIRMGSTNVRVGSKIFGARSYGPGAAASMASAAPVAH